MAEGERGVSADLEAARLAQETLTRLNDLEPFVLSGEYSVERAFRMVRLSAERTVRAALAVRAGREEAAP